jgi:hypothetical protein
MLLALTVSACVTTKSGLVSPAQNFASATSTLQAKEQQLLNDANSADRIPKTATEFNKYLNGLPYDSKNPAPFITADQAQARMVAVKALQLYSQHIVALLDQDMNADIDSNSIALANSLTAQIPAIKSEPKFGAGIAAALGELLKIFTDKKAYDSVVAVARDTDPSVRELTNALKSDSEVISGRYRTTNPFDDITRQQYLDRVLKDSSSVSDKKKEFTQTATDSSLDDVADKADSMARLAASVAAAHAVLAKGQTQTFAQMAQEAFNRAKDASDIFNKSKKG